MKIDGLEYPGVCPTCNTETEREIEYGGGQGGGIIKDIYCPKCHPRQGIDMFSDDLYPKRNCMICGKELELVDIGMYRCINKDHKKFI